MSEDNTTIRVDEDHVGDTGPAKDGGTPNPSQTAECIQDYIENPLEGLIKLATSEQTVACIEYMGKMNGQNYKLCQLLKSKNIHEEYFGIKNCITTVFSKQAGLIDENVDALLTKTEALVAALDSSLNAIKVAKTKLWDVRESACKLDAARNDSCNSEQLSSMSKIPELKGIANGKRGIARFQALVDNIVTEANNLYDAVDDTFEKGVKVAGIQAYMNIGSLKEFSSTLKTDAETFDADAEANIKYCMEQMSATQKAYSEGLQFLDTSLFAKIQAHLNNVSLELMQTYAEDLGDEECKDRNTDLEKICSDIKGVFQADINCSSTD